MKKILTTSAFIFALLAGLLALPGKASAQSVNYKAYGIFIYTFARFTEWPVELKDTPVIKFAVLGNSEVYNELLAVLPTKTINGKKCSIERVDSPEKLKGYHLVFIPALKSSQLSEVLLHTSQQPLLVITENDGLIKKGAGISFVITDQKKLGFELNETALGERKLRVAAQLKALAVSGY